MAHQIQVSARARPGKDALDPPAGGDKTLVGREAFQLGIGRFGLRPDGAGLRGVAGRGVPWLSTATWHERPLIFSRQERGSLLPLRVTPVARI